MELQPLIFMVLTLIGAGLTVMVAYGALIRKRDIVLSGLFYYSFLPIIGETMGMLTTKHSYHLLFIGLFLVQLVLTTLKGVPFDPHDKTLKEYAKRIGGSILVINIISAVFVFSIVPTHYPIYIGIFHVIISLSLAYGIALRLQGKIN